MTQSLDRLAEQFGITLQYTDIWGKAHRASPETLRALLEAMGIDAAGDDAALAALAARPWEETLPPVAVWRPGQPRVVELRVDATVDRAQLVYRIEEENGATHEGPISAEALTETARTRSPRARIAFALTLPVALPDGYHRLSVREESRVLATTVLVVAPGACYQPPGLAAGGRVFGPAVQLYSVRSNRNWGIGDFTDLATVVEQWAAQGAAVVGLNPLHALFPHDPARASPYSPSSRLFLDTLYLDVEAIPEFGECRAARALVGTREFQRELERVRGADQVDYVGVARLKDAVLHLLAAHFRERHLATSTPRAAAFRAFVLGGGEALERLATFEVLQAHFHARDSNVWGWPAWPEPYRDPDSPEVVAFVSQHRDAIEAAQYRQWQADAQLQGAAERARELGLEVGLYRDLAVSIDRGGAEAWSSRALYAVAAGVGAPPDAFSPQGQNWGLPPLIPHALRRTAFAPFVATLRANMRHAGALRIDHVMGLARLFWIPEGASAAEGAYVRYPLDELMAVLALESQRQRCLVIGEDLGTVPDEIRTALRESAVLSYRLLWFERGENGSFLPPERYPAQALVAASTHDLPTLAGWWEGRDIEARERCGLFGDEGIAERERQERVRDRERLLRALSDAGLAPAGPPGATPAAMSPDLARRIQTLLARSPAKLMIVQLEDVLGVVDQVNLPGTTDQHPNWKARLPLALEQWMDDPRFEDLARALRRTRRAGVQRDAAARPDKTQVPRATYRLQLHRDFTLRDAIALVPYLAALGVSHAYCSPYLRARPGSRHGYDIVDHGALNPEIGDSADLDAFVAALREHGMGHLLDVVPNHMGVMGSDNLWWMDVLESGPASIYADYFDIDWSPRDADSGPRLLVPILGDHYGNVLERGELKLAFEAATGAFAVRYYDHRLPLDPRTYRPLLERVRQSASGMAPSAATRLAALLSGMESLPLRHATAPSRLHARHEAKEALKAQLARLASDDGAVRAGIDAVVSVWNGVPGDARSTEALHELLEMQAYRVAYWRVASDEINYRRFFDVNDLAGLRTENEAVFEATHRFVLGLAAAGKVDGLRIDHPDGLHDPARYFQRLQHAYAQATGRPLPEAASDRPLYVAVEKILASHEELATTWAVHGTTGYRFANIVNGLFVDASAKTRVDRAWRAFVREEAVDYDTAVANGKRTVMESTLAAELSVLTRRLVQIARADPHTRDFTYTVLRQALIEVTAAFPVYRTYIAERVGANDRRYVEWAVARAKRRSRVADVSVFDFVRNVLLLRPPPQAGEALCGAYRAFAMRFQQFTAPVTAKGVEDTALYVFNRLVALNEVGGDPDRFGTTLAAFHAANADRAARWPHTLIATSTHDNKRSEDVRARIDLISEMPGAWRLLTRRWSRLNRSKKRTRHGNPVPSRNDEYLLYQTLLGSLPDGPLDGPPLEAYRERVKAYAIKAAREAKVSTSWVNADPDYEAALTAFVDGLLAPGERNLFLEDLASQRTFFAWFGALNSVAMTALKFTSPGVPDIYQGNELFDFSLVDPDNRRPVDYAQRRELLEELVALAAQPAHTLAGTVRALFDRYGDGRAKLWVTYRALQARAAHPDLWRDGEYIALPARGARERHVVAFARRHDDECCVVVAGRLFTALGAEPGTLPVGHEIWTDTRIDLAALGGPRAFHDVLTGRRIESAAQLAIGEVLTHFPVAILASEPR